MSIERKSGILLHVSSLPNKLGIGTFGKEAFEFVDFLKKSGQQFWQILPLNPVAEGNSPYSTYSAFALNPYFIDLDLLTEDGLLQEIEYKNVDFGSNPTRVDYGKIYENKMRVLRHAYENSKEKHLEGFRLFVENNKEWIGQYAEFMSFRCYFNTSLQNWNLEAKRKVAQAMENYHSLIGQDELNFWIFLQYICDKQWMDLKKYANDNGIRIFGDMPIYVSGDSADVWSNPEVFDVDVDLNPLHVAGCPPDEFALDGQRWGMPVFNWDYLEQTDYDWWMKRIARNDKLFDVIRIDHFRGLESFYSIPIGEETARNGVWKKAKGKIFFDKIKNRFGDTDIILEDLGFITKDVMDLKEYTGYAGMKVFQFADFNDTNHPYLPHNCEVKSVIYTSTHDNDTLFGWLKNLSDDEKRFVQCYLDTFEEYNMTWKCIEKVMSSKSKLSIIQMQDFLELGSEARMNIPGIAYGNWEWRVIKDALSADFSEKINQTTKKYNR